MPKNKSKKYMRKQNRKTAKKSKSNKSNKKFRNINNSHIVKVMLELLNMVKLYHWKTRSFAQHKATDELYAKLNENIDSFVEVLLGKSESRINMVSKQIDLLDESNTTEFKQRIYEYRNFLVEIDLYFDPSHDTDLLNIRDEILADINQFLYLMTFDK
jgi:DNA-binding ferritin-like protein